MENKDWREEVSIIYGQIMRSAMGTQRPVSKNEAKELLVHFIEFILKSKQEEIEKAIDELPTMYTLTSISGETIPLISKDDLKPIISNLLLK